MDWLNWENAAYLIAIILGGMVTMVGTKWRMILREMKEVAETYHAAKKTVRLRKKKNRKLLKNAWTYSLKQLKWFGSSNCLTKNNLEI